VARNGRQFVECVADYFAIALCACGGREEEGSRTQQYSYQDRIAPIDAPHDRSLMPSHMLALQFGYVFRRYGAGRFCYQFNWGGRVNLWSRRILLETEQHETRKESEDSRG